MLEPRKVEVTEDSQARLKVQFYDSDVGYENLWATYLGNDSYRVESIPYFIYGISLHDVVEARPDPEGRLQFLRVVGRSGNRTLRARPEQFAIAERRGVELIDTLKSFGCGVEVLEPRLVAVDVPKQIDMSAVTGFLTGDGIPWEYANPALEELDKKT